MVNLVAMALFSSLNGSIINCFTVNISKVIYCEKKVLKECKNKLFPSSKMLPKISFQESQSKHFCRFDQWLLFNYNLWAFTNIFMSLFFFRCNNKRSCNVPVDSTIFGDPCPGTFKYVEVHYACRKGKTTFIQ